MSEIEGYVLAHCSDEKAHNEMIKEFKKDNILTLKDDSYQVWDIKSDSIVDLYFYTSEYADTAQLSKYILKKYSPNILISSFDKKGFIDGKKVDRKKAFSALSTLSPSIGFYLNVEYRKYKEACDILEHSSIDITHKVAGVPNAERCFFGDYAPLMAYAVDNGYHDHYCQYDEIFPFNEKGVHVLHRLVKTSDIALVKKALVLGASPNGLNGDNESILHSVGEFAFNDYYDLNVFEVISLLASFDADFNLKNWRGDTPILSIYHVVVGEINDYREEIVSLMEALISNGAEIDVFDQSGAGLLTYYSGVIEVESMLLAIKPDLKPFNEHFDTDSYIRKQASIYDGNLPDKYDEYFCHCIEFGFVDFMFDEERVSILQSLTIGQLWNILFKIPSSNNAIKILKAFIDHNLPIFIEQNIEEGAEEMQCITIFDYKINTEVVSFYNQVREQPHKIIVANYSKMGPSMNSKEIVSL